MTTETLPREAPARRAFSFTAALFETKPGPVALDVTLTAVRVALAWVFIFYGAGKLFGAFNGPGIHSTALYFSNTAHLRPGGFFAVVGGVIEFGGGVAMAFGLLSRLAALALFGDQVMAMITVTWSNGLGPISGTVGYGYNISLAVLALAVVVLGAGRVSVDRFLAARLRTGG